MTYFPGDTVDLSHLNRKVVAPAVRKSFAENLQEVGTSFIFKDNLKAFRRIEVAAA
jgi:hypothetical protein